MNIDNLYIKDLKTIGLIFENFFSKTGISKDEPYMYMYSDKNDNTDHFKHSLTRRYKSVEGTG